VTEQQKGVRSVFRQDVTVDPKGRLRFPVALKVWEFVKLGTDEHGCIMISKSSEGGIRVRVGKKGQKSITIPSALRKKSLSFIDGGRKVTIAKRGDHLELWPQK
jgi:hypothetical protein